MPELPEVETTCRGIKTAVVGQSIQNVIVREKRLRWPIPNSVGNLKKIKIMQVSRRAKYILLQTTTGTLIIHLGMSGRLCVVDSEISAKKHDHVDFVLNNGKTLRYTDPRRFGSVLWTTDEPLQYPLLINLGPEPLSKAFTATYLFQTLQRKKIMIKQLIMDQAIVVGVGNIYANEALFAAKISPMRQAGTLSISECKQLIQSIQKILKRAIVQGGTTLRDFLSVEGNPGYFVQKLFVYGREGQACLHCNKLLKNVKIGQRATVFCDSCQQ